MRAYSHNLEIRGYKNNKDVGFQRIYNPIQHLSKYFACGEMHLKCEIKGKSILARLTGRDGNTHFWCERLLEEQHLCRTE